MDVVKGLMMAAALMAAGAVQADVPRVLEICQVGMAEGGLVCADTQWASQEYLDCTDRADAPPIGHWERGGGVIEWGNTVGGVWQPDGRAVYEWSDRAVVSGQLVRAMIGVDEDRIFGDGLDRACRSGRFVP